MQHTIENPLTGYTMTFIEANEEVFRMSETMRPGAPPPVMHVHPYQEERFEVVRGSVNFTAAGRDVLCGPGEKIAVPAGIPHTFRNASEGETEMFGEYRPGLPKLSRRFHEVYFALARAGLTDAKGTPKIWQIAVEMPLFSDHVRLASPPWPIQRFTLALLRPVARLLGYRPLELEPSPAEVRPALPSTV